MIDLKAYTYLLDRGSYNSQTLVALAESKEEAIEKIKVYLKNESSGKEWKVTEQNVYEEETDVFETFGVDG